MKNFWPALKLFSIMTVLLGVIYPVAITLVGQVFFKQEANGAFIMKDGKTIGSSLIAQKFANPRYFFSRPSALDYNPLPSGGTNLAPTASKLKASAEANRQALGEQAPQDLIFASASGLDPHISPAAAVFQIERVAQARGWTSSQRADLERLVQNQIKKPLFGFLGEETVNVLELNLAVDSM